MPIPFIKILHFGSILFFVSSVAASLIGDNKSKTTNILIGLTSAFILITGMGMAIFGLGLSHGSGVRWPLWLYIKLFIWLLLAVGTPLLIRRLIENRALAGYLILILVLTAASIAVIRPFQ